MAGQGVIAAVCISSEGNVPKYPKEQITVGPFGFVGDFHAGETRINRKTRQPKFNDRQISLVEQEVLITLNWDLKISLGPGHLGENVLTRGMPLAELQPGALLRLGSGVILEVTEQNIPCANLQIYHRLLVKTIHHMRGRGVLAIVKAGAGTILKPGDGIEVI